MLTTRQIEDLLAKLEATDEGAVRLNLANHVYGRDKRRIVEAWLSDRESARVAVRGSRAEEREERS